MARDRTLLWSLLVDYHRRPTTWRRMVPVGLAVGARLVSGPLRRTDALAAAAAVAAYGPLEWFGHHHVLHGLPTLGLPASDETPAQAVHLEHHRNPDDVDLLFDQLAPVPPAVLGLLALSTIVARRYPAQLTGLATLLAAMATYHWVHYLMHAPYEPRSAWLRAITANHLLHHDGTDDRRMGVMFSTTDRVLAWSRSSSTTAPATAAS